MHLLLLCATIYCADLFSQVYCLQEEVLMSQGWAGWRVGKEGEEQGDEKVVADAVRGVAVE